MFYHDRELQFRVRVEKPNPIFARALQQAIGGVEGEIRVCLQYLFQAWGARGPTTKYRDLLLETGTEEIAHIEMLATAVALNLENAPMSVKEDMAQDAIGGSVLNGMSMRHILSSGLAAMPVNSDGVPFDCSHVYASGNLAGDMFANVAAEATGRTLAVRLYGMTDDPGMKEMLSFLIARDTMHQQQWLAVVEELGGAKALPIPNSFSQEQENKEFSYAFIGTMGDGSMPVQGRWTSGPSLDGKGEFRAEPARPLGGEPKLSPARPGSGAQNEQISMTAGGVSEAAGSVMQEIKNAVTGS